MGIQIGTLETVMVTTNVINGVIIPRLIGGIKRPVAPASLPLDNSPLASLANPLQHLFPTAAVLEKKLFPVVL